MQTFLLDYLLPNRPVMIRNATKGWAASTEWVNDDGGIGVEALVAMYGGAAVEVESGTSPNRRALLAYLCLLVFWLSHCPGLSCCFVPHSIIMCMYQASYATVRIL